MTFRLLTFRIACFLTVMPLALVAGAFQSVGFALGEIAELVAGLWQYAFVGECPCEECDTHTFPDDDDTIL
jgi:hypothetical protein